MYKYKCWLITVKSSNLNFILTSVTYEVLTTKLACNSLLHISYVSAQVFWYSQLKLLQEWMLKDLGKVSEFKI